tara:strand:+ start:118 stop:711 length:594 start_codon:yes stop_codon:yes gene_type:complete
MIYTEPAWKALVVTTNEPLFTPEQCQLVMQKGLSLAPVKGTVGTRLKGDNIGTHDETIRKSTVSWIPFNEMPDMYREIEQAVLATNNNHFGFEGLKMSEYAQFTQYKTGGEHYSWHMDCDMKGERQPPVRKISMTIPLVPETDFDGGQLEFNKAGDVLRLKQGHAVFFASFLQHRVTPVTRGTRYSLVQWFNGPSFR